MKYFTLPLFFVLLVSCTHKYEQEIIEVEKMQVTLAGVIDTFEALEPEKVDAAFAEHEMLMGQIKKYFSPDSITHEISLTLDNYKAIKKGAKSFNKDYSQLKENIFLQKDQLEKLKLDLSNKAIDETKVQDYLEHEKKQISLLQQNLGTLVFNYDIVLTTQESLAPAVKSLIFNNGQ
jgi:hypothetical protein